MKKAFKINRLDHVALRVSDLDKSATWYQEVLSMERLQVQAWGNIPVFLASGKSAVALFPYDPSAPQHNPKDKAVKIDHFAFLVDKAEYAGALEHFNRLGIPYKQQDHFYFHSTYILDPDGHTIELTCLQEGHSDFYEPY